MLDKIFKDKNLLFSIKNISGKKHFPMTMKMSISYTLYLGSVFILEWPLRDKGMCYVDTIIISKLSVLFTMRVLFHFIPHSLFQPNT